jgi:phosphoribosyl 1,2-cyclic phosphodiesterase
LDSESPLSVQYWGARGSVPTPGPSTTRYGGNTSCVEVRAGEERIVLDAGTGILGLGEKLAAQRLSTTVTLFLSHLHWDHIQGLPFFAPAYKEGCRIQIMAPPQTGVPLDSILRGQMGPVHFPLPFDALSAEISFHELTEDGWEGTNVRVRGLRVRHASFTLGYRVEAFGRSVVFIPDNELVGGEYPVTSGWMDRLIAFVDGADLLIHDAMFTTEEYQELEGRGHSTFSQVLELAERAGVRTLRFFHHSPKRSDSELQVIVQHFREELGIRGIGLELDAAAEGALDNVELAAPAP